MTDRATPRPLNPSLYTRAQCLAALGKLPPEHSAWHEPREKYPCEWCRTGWAWYGAVFE